MSTDLSFPLFYIAFLIQFVHEARHETVADGGADPYLGEVVVSVLVHRLEKRDVQLVDGSNERIDDENNPQVVLRVGFPFATGVEIGQRAEQQHC